MSDKCAMLFKGIDPQVRDAYRLSCMRRCQTMTEDFTDHMKDVIIQEGIPKKEVRKLTSNRK